VDYKDWRKQAGHPPAPRFEKSKLAPGRNEFPKFSQQTAKASMTKHIMLWLRDVLRRPSSVSDLGLLGTTRLIMMTNFAGFEEVCDRNGRWLPEGDREELAACMERALVCMNALRSAAMAEGRYFYHITPKCHMATHLAYDIAASGVNPRRTTCYADEDMVGRVKKIVNKCHGASAGRTSLQRYAVLVCTRWWTRLAELRGLRG